MSWIIMHERFNLRYGLSSEQFNLAALISTDTLKLHPVTDDSLCDIARVTINRDRNVSATTARTVYLITEGKLYMALDRSQMMGEFTPAFFLDSTLTQVIRRYAM